MKFINKISGAIALVVFFAVLCTLTVSFTPSIVSAEGEAVSLTGFLIDEHCFLKKATDPGSDTRKCKLMNGCIKGGFGIAVLQPDSSYKFYYFDGDFFTETDADKLDGTGGQRTAYDFIIASTKESYLAITVTGTILDGTKPSTNAASTAVYSVIQINELREATSQEALGLPTGEAVSFTGFLIDEHCFLKKATDPGSDTRKCKLMNGCIKGGFGITVLQPDSSYKFYYFDGNFFTETDADKLDGTGGQRKAYDFIIASTKESYLAVTVTGMLLNGTKQSTNAASTAVYSVMQLSELREATSLEATGLPTGVVLIDSENSEITSQTNQINDIPQTGENSNQKDYILLAVLSVIVLVLLAVTARKKRIER